MIFSEIRPCKTKGALEVVPATPDQLQLDAAAEVLAKTNFRVVNANILIVVSRPDIAETTIFEDGHMLVKTLDPREAHRSAAIVYREGTGIPESATFEEYLAAGRVTAKRAR
jgi:hypothetical protein